MTVSIIICTRNRANDLNETLRSIFNCDLNSGLTAEIYVVDNGSSDHTAEVINNHKTTRSNLHYLHEKRVGQVMARNTGIAASKGQIIVFTDDDVRVPKQWLHDLTAPIISGQADAVAGGVQLAPQLRKPWMSKLHRSLLASTETISEQLPERMVGANMAFSRKVLDRVPSFDPALGPGALGFMDDSLFSMQLIKSGYRIVSSFKNPIEHHFLPARLTRSDLISRASKQGASKAYVDYHWKHRSVKFPLIRGFLFKMKLAWSRSLRKAELGDEGIPEWEIFLIQHCSHFLAMRQNLKNPRHYSLFGTTKLEHSKCSVNI